MVFFLRFRIFRREQLCCPGLPLLDLPVDPTVAFPSPTAMRLPYLTKEEMENTRLFTGRVCFRVFMSEIGVIWGNRKTK